ncbi:beta-1,3-galactosyltransferase 5 isoform X2 [Cephus cinctus]|uniref:Hexosyltransferase n=1 Tax=Cephus cinctus TaxID=211228 RepID=A0AAJ7RAX5_CEPCN|nr:beta-1,3-galactosyltransferase 5 isoform X2 [Cephus cinctus]
MDCDIILRVFLLGMLNGEASRKTHVTQDSIYDESLKFKDIVQGNFQEAYRNLTYKHLMGLRWAVNTCHHANYIMKMDDDIVVNLYDILNILQTRGTIENTLMGYVLNNMLPIREPANKWFVTQEEFALNVYPEFLSGWLYITSSKIAEKLVSYAQVYPKYFWIDDLFITGILRNDLKIGFQSIRKFYATDYRYLKCCIKGKEKRLKCEFAIGPNGGNAELQVEFKDFAQFCRTNCSPRTEEFSVNNTCIVAHEEPNWVKGRALIEPVRML